MSNFCPTEPPDGESFTQPGQTRAATEQRRRKRKQHCPGQRADYRERYKQAEKEKMIGDHWPRKTYAIGKRIKLAAGGNGADLVPDVENSAKKEECLKDPDQNTASVQSAQSSAIPG